MYLTKDLYPEYIKKKNTKKTDQMKTKKTNHFLKGRTTQLIFPSTGERIGAQVAKSRVSAWVGPEGIHARVAWCEGQSSGRMKCPNKERQETGYQSPSGVRMTCIWDSSPEPEQVRQWTIHGEPAQPRAPEFKKNKEDSVVRKGQQHDGRGN